jgi:hypothetical protein
MARKGWHPLAPLCAATPLVVYLSSAPVAHEFTYVRLRIAATIVDALLVPVIEFTGRPMAIAGAVLLALLGTWRLAGAPRPAIPSMNFGETSGVFGLSRKEQPTADVPMTRDLDRLFLRAAAEPVMAPPAAPPRDSATAASPQPRPVVLVRRPRERGGDWSEARSWFGGLPRLGGADWPSGADGVPLPFAAQIDLTEIAAACPESPLPPSGSLAFFLNSGAVVHVAPGDHAPTPPPAALPIAFDECGYPFPERPSRLSRPLFPFWPIEPIGLPLPDGMRDFRDEERHDEIREAQDTLLSERVQPRQHAFSVYSARQAEIAGADDLWWFGVEYIDTCLHAAVDDAPRLIAQSEQALQSGRAWLHKLEAAPDSDDEQLGQARRSVEYQTARLQKLQRQRNELPAFIAALRDPQDDSLSPAAMAETALRHARKWLEDLEASPASTEGNIAAGRGAIEKAEARLEAIRESSSEQRGSRSPWTELNPTEIGVVKELLSAARADFKDLANLPNSLDDLRNLCIRRMITGDSAALAALPVAMLAFINERYRLTTQSPHQMFGLAGIKQRALYAHTSDLLLLQLSYDDMNEWRFGDLGLWHFWLSRADAAARRWDKVTLTFECA